MGRAPGLEVPGISSPPDYAGPPPREPLRAPRDLRHPSPRALKGSWVMRACEIRESAGCSGGSAIPPPETLPPAPQCDLTAVLTKMRSDGTSPRPICLGFLAPLGSHRVAGGCLMGGGLYYYIDRALVHVPLRATPPRPPCRGRDRVGNDGACLSTPWPPRQGGQAGQLTQASSVRLVESKVNKSCRNSKYE